MMGFTALERCDGCGQCELACAFRATETFWLPASAIRLKKATGGEAGYLVRVDFDDCDLCEGDPVAACERVCKTGVLKRSLLSQLRGVAEVR